MIHLGDITKIKGDSIPIVDVITGGSPCQNLSIAGNRDGLKGEQSKLFTEQIRIIKEMREGDRRTGRTNELVRPRFMVWENVPGAFSSNGGRDFQTVLTETARIAEPNCPYVPLPDKGKWSKSGCIYSQMGEWSVAWTVHNAEDWGLPQRRIRISLVADFGGLSAAEVLFERKGMRRDSEEKPGKGEAHATDIGESFDGAISFQERAGKPGGGKGILVQKNRTGALTGFCNQYVLDAYQHYGYRESDTVGTISASMGKGNGGTPLVIQECKAHYRKYNNDGDYVEGVGTLRASGGDYGGGSETLIVDNMVRRLTPLECERLQGYPDGWTDIGEWTDSKGKKHSTSDSARYKALGNSIAIPFWMHLMKRISDQYDRPATLGSLFDGIGGFPYCWETCNGMGTAIWASEIEEFPIAVTKRHFGNKQGA